MVTTWPAATSFFTVSGDAATKIFFSGTSAGYSTNPFITATGAAGVSGATLYTAITTGTTMKVFAKGAAKKYLEKIQVGPEGWIEFWKA